MILSSSMNDEKFTPLEFSDPPLEEKEIFVGKKIVDVKMCDRCRFEWANSEPYETFTEGGLTFVLEDKNGDIHRVILGYTELGHWIYENKKIEDKK